MGLITHYSEIAWGKVKQYSSSEIHSTVSKCVCVLLVGIGTLLLLLEVSEEAVCLRKRTSKGADIQLTSDGTSNRCIMD